MRVHEGRKKMSKPYGHRMVQSERVERIEEYRVSTSAGLPERPPMPESELGRACANARSARHLLSVLESLKAGV